MSPPGRPKTSTLVVMTTSKQPSQTSPQHSNCCWTTSLLSSPSEPTSSPILTSSRPFASTSAPSWPAALSSNLSWISDSPTRSPGHQTQSVRQTSWPLPALTGSSFPLCLWLSTSRRRFTPIRVPTARRNSRAHDQRISLTSYSSRDRSRSTQAACARRLRALSRRVIARLYQQLSRLPQQHGLNHTLDLPARWPLNPTCRRRSPARQRSLILSLLAKLRDSGTQRGVFGLPVVGPSDSQQRRRLVILSSLYTFTNNGSCHYCKMST